MDLSPPTTVVFVVSVILALLTLEGHFVVIPFFSEHGFWMAIIAYIVLAVGNVAKGL